MSASNKKQARQNADEAVQQTQPQKERSNGVLYAVIGVVAAVVVIALLVWNSNLFQNRAAAVTINGESYTAADVNFYYFKNFQTGAYYYGMMGMYDVTKAPENQIFDESTGMTWHEYFLEQSIENLRNEAAMAAEAAKAGYTMSEEGKAAMQKALLDLETGRVTSGYPSVDAYLKANLGGSMTKDKYIECLERSVLASEYAGSYADTLSCEQTELDSYYLDNKNNMDTYTATVFQFQASVETVDAEGKTIEMTEEEIAAKLEQSKKENKKLAEELMARLQAGEDAKALNDEYSEQLLYSTISQDVLGTSLNGNYSEWMFDAERKAGDITMVEYAGSTTSNLYNYCVIRMENRFLDQQPTADIRHILVSAGSEPTEEQYAEAMTKAEALVEEWKAAGSTEEKFAELAIANSADASSAEQGGFLNVSDYDGYGKAFVDWALADGRKAGEIGFVKNDFSVTKGYHIMYYVGENAPYWEQVAESTLLNEQYGKWQSDILAGYPAEKGDGLKYVG